ncbi:Wadjet anti-phage system protein JetD domain-containing protein [Variovorax sp. dw_308]|uniref:Wadjet anti-phage system protein JetD domain-containing protein n=1 Tax=Variovorax sp. dw_308 TaxID=2721546 RepID=UPI001C474F51|nr:Wadjet anti-phage system protein JetD domain-containing protein [Variovorax sp. dw_308]
MSEFLERLRSGRRKRVDLQEVMQHYYSVHPSAQNSHERRQLLLAELQSLAGAGVIELPARGSWEQVGSPPLPLWIQIHRVSPAASQALDLSSVAWAPELGFWPQLRVAQLQTLHAINEFLIRRRGKFALVPIKERSLEIFGDEKRLDDLATGDTLFNGKLHLKTIGCFRVPQPLPYRKANAAGKAVLVIENHNTFWSFGEWNEVACRYAAVVYGQGLNFRLTGRALHQVIDEADAVGAEYFGDLDPTGVSIPREFNACVESGYPTVRPAIALYEALIARGVQRLKAECANFDEKIAMEWLGRELGVAVTDAWRLGLWYPQEALGTEQLILLGSQAFA